MYRQGEPNASHTGQRYKASDQSDRPTNGRPVGGPPGGEDDLSAAAVAAYRASIERGAPLSERELATVFGKTSRRWARSRMAKARGPWHQEPYAIGPRRGDRLIQGWR